MRFPTIARLALPLLVLPLAGSTPRPAYAQSGFAFQQPAASLNLRIGAGLPTANDDLFKFFHEQLCTPGKCRPLNSGDFRGVAFGADLAIRAASRVDIVIGAAYDGSSNRSEMREWLDNNDQPIEQMTEFYRVPITVSAKYYLTERGTSLAKHAWVPNSFTPYVFAGAGATIYSLTQDGDWVDYQTLDVFSRRFTTDGAAWTGQAGAGGEWWLSPHFGLVGDGRYTWGKANLTRDFADFDKIDLSGFQVTTGISVRF